ncbi:hypothetical protein QE418_003410 [Microbacterium testaceum]|uniref:hypothetical protein n=1 Tax=Microbacterium TaxID=33882 RepID=UPI002786604E|nr:MULTISPECIES: hypothetical protein [Microbacterium]MDQ1113962.1 hypothetical protein [Microbacterium testaceum]MDR6098932.1 hypothetical protein [Microbacterium sp. SORGH_AS_0454]
MTWKDDALRSSLDAMRSKEPPTVQDSDVVGMAINRLQRAVVKMQAKQYDDELNEHLVRAGEMLGWVAENMWNRQDSEPEREAAPPAPGIMHVAGGSTTACGIPKAQATHITNGIRFADCVECLRTVAKS